MAHCIRSFSNNLAVNHVNCRASGILEKKMPIWQSFGSRQKAKCLNDNVLRKTVLLENSARLCKSLLFLQTFRAEQRTGGVHGINRNLRIRRLHALHGWPRPFRAGHIAGILWSWISGSFFRFWKSGMSDATNSLQMDSKCLYNLGLISRNHQDNWRQDLEET